jgi:hypothetical protein
LLDDPIPIDIRLYRKPKAFDHMFFLHLNTTIRYTTVLRFPQRSDGCDVRSNRMA